MVRERSKAVHTTIVKNIGSWWSNLGDILDMFTERGPQINALKSDIKYTEKVTSENSYLLKIEIEEFEPIMPRYIMDTAGHAMGMAGTRIL